MQICRLGTHFISGQDRFLFLLGLLGRWLTLLHRRSRGKSIRVMQMMLGIIHVDYITFLVTI
jgi:hypothetical protein